MRLLLEKGSSSYIFGELTGDGPADAILRALRQAGADGLMKRDIFALFDRNLPAAKIDAALARLQASGKAVSRQPPPQAEAGRRPQRGTPPGERARNWVRTNWQFVRNS